VVTAPPKWSPKGDWILYLMPDSLSLLSPDGKTDRLLSKRRWNLFTWSKDGSSVYGLRAEKRHWMLVSIAVADGKEKTLSEFDLPLGQGLFGSLSLAPDGASVTTSLFHNKSDIWLIEDFNLTRR